MSNRKAGTIHLSIDGKGYSTKGNFKYGMGMAKRQPIFNSNGGVEGFKEIMESAPFVEGEIYDQSDLDLSALFKTDDATVTLQLANGKVIVFKDAWYCGDYTGNTEEGNINFRMESKTATEIR